jgi:uncharacterized protein
VSKKPSTVFDRDWEWEQLQGFVNGKGLGVVSGRRRHGKSFLLRQLAKERKGFYHQAIELDRRPALDRFAGALAEHLGWPAAPRFNDWEQALRAAFAKSSLNESPQLVVLDEFPYLLKGAPELLSVVQLLVDDWRADGTRHNLILCGSSLSVMSTVLGAASPLNGRATLDLNLASFDYRTAGKFWNAPDSQTAFAVDAIFGGAPGYRELMDGRLPTLAPLSHKPAKAKISKSQAATTPSTEPELADWLATGPLNPAHVLFSEDDYLLREESQLTDRAHYLSILQAVAHGATTSANIAAALGRDSRSLHHSLNGLERSGFLESTDDALRDQRPVYRIVDPLVRFCRLITRPAADRLEQRRWREVMTERAPALQAGIYSPHFEHLSREWTRRFATDEQLGGQPTRVAPSVLSDAMARAKVELDVVAIQTGFNEKPRVLAIGEAKHTTAPRSMGDVLRLANARDLVTATRSTQFDTSDVKLLLFSAAGFTNDVRNEATKRNDLILIDLETLYA